MARQFFKKKTPKRLQLSDWTRQKKMYFTAHYFCNALNIKVLRIFYVYSKLRMQLFNYQWKSYVRHWVHTYTYRIKVLNLVIMLICKLKVYRTAWQETQWWFTYLPSNCLLIVAYNNIISPAAAHKTNWLKRNRIRQKTEASPTYPTLCSRLHLRHTRIIYYARKILYNTTTTSTTTVQYYNILRYSGVFRGDGGEGGGVRIYHNHSLY